MHIVSKVGAIVFHFKSTHQCLLVYCLDEAVMATFQLQVMSFWKPTVAALIPQPLTMVLGFHLFSFSITYHYCV